MTKSCRIIVSFIVDCSTAVAAIAGGRSGRQILHRSWIQQHKDTLLSNKSQFCFHKLEFLTVRTKNGWRKKFSLEENLLLFREGRYNKCVHAELCIPSGAHYLVQRSRFEHFHSTSSKIVGLHFLRTL